MLIFPCQPDREIYGPYDLIPKIEGVWHISIAYLYPLPQHTHFLNTLARDYFIIHDILRHFIVLCFIYGVHNGYVNVQQIANPSQLLNGLFTIDFHMNMKKLRKIYTYFCLICTVIHRNRKAITNDVPKSHFVVCHLGFELHFVESNYP